MKKLVNLILLVATSLLLLSCEKENISGAYPYDRIIFYNENDSTMRVVVENDSMRITSLTAFSKWDQSLYPMEFWVDDEEISSIGSNGYLKGKKEGKVTVYAKVMSTYGELEDSITYKVKGLITKFIEEYPYTLKGWGVDRNKDGIITVTEVHETEILKGYIGSDWLVEIAEYMPKLKELEVSADTTSRTLDLSTYKFTKLTIHDYCFEYALDESEAFYLYNCDINRYKNFFLKELILNNAIEHLTIWHIPGIKSLNLQQYTNLKTFTRKTNSRCDSEWYDLELILPESIENVQLFNTEINFNYIYPKLNKLVYNFQGYADISKHKTIELNKKQIPNLKIIDARKGIRYLDISSFEFSDIDSLYAIADTIIMSKSMYEKKYVHLYLYAEHYIIK